MTLGEYLSTHQCAVGRPDLLLVGENEGFRLFVCLSCKEEWAISRSRAKAQAREEARLGQIRRITEEEKQASKRVFGRYYAGRRHAA